MKLDPFQPRGRKFQIDLRLLGDEHQKAIWNRQEKIEDLNILRTLWLLASQHVEGSAEAVSSRENTGTFSLRPYPGVAKPPRASSCPARKRIPQFEQAT